MDENEFEQLPDVSSSDSGIDSSSFSSGDQLASPTVSTPSSDSSNNLRERLDNRQFGRAAYEKTLDNKNYYDDKLKENEQEKNKLDDERKELEKENKEKADNLKEKENALSNQQQNLSNSRSNNSSSGSLNRNNGNNENNGIKDKVGQKIRDIKSRRNEIKQNRSNVNAAKKDKDNAEKEKKESDEKLKKNENDLKKNELEKKGLEKDKKRANTFSKLHPVEAAKMKAMHALKQLKKLIIIKILLPLLLIMVAISLLVMLVYEVFEKVDKIATDVANVVEKMDNFINGLGFQNSEEAFYEEIKELQKQYNNALDVPLLLSTIFYDDIQNNMDASDVDAKVVDNSSSMLSFATVFGWVKDKIKESNETVGKDGYVYSSNKIYRLRMLAKKMVTKSGTQSLPWDEYLQHCAERIGRTIENFFSLDNVVEILLTFLTGGTWLIPNFVEAMVQMLDGSEVFETTDFANILKNNPFTDLFEIFRAVFESVSDIEGIEGCLDGLVCIEYSTYQKNDSEYYKYLKEYYIPKMPEFKKYLTITDGNTPDEQIDKIIKEIKEIYRNYEEFFGLRKEDVESYSITCSGNISADIVSNVRKPVDYFRTAVFSGSYAYGITDRVKHTGLDINANTTGNQEGDPVFSIADNGVVEESTVDGTYKCENCKGGWVKISYSNTYNNKLYKFSVIYGGLSLGSLKLKSGDSVKRDDEIGSIGNADESESGIPSLHFGFYDSEKKVFLDPSNIFNPCSKEIRGESMAEKMWWALLDAGFSKEAAAGVIGNAAAETGGADIDHIVSYSLENGESYEAVMSKSNRGLGLLGWTYKDFKTGLMDYAKFVGGNWYDDKVQIEYMIHSIIGNNSGNTWDKRVWYISAENRRLGQTYEAFTNASTPEEAATIFCSFYERPAAGCLPHREREARRAYDRFKDLQDPGAPAVTVTPTGATGPVSAGGQYIWPCDAYRVNDKFGNRYAEMASHRNAYGYGGTVQHYAIDIAGKGNFNLYAACNGTVGSVNEGNYHITYINCGTNASGEEVHLMYEHGDATVRSGQTVKAGDKIGTANGWGPAGSRSYGIHLDFRVYTLKDGKKIFHNPLTYLYNMSYDGKQDGNMRCNVMKYNGTMITTINASNFEGEAELFKYNFGTGTQDNSDTKNSHNYFYN